jgi:hypothetical protein
MPRLALLAAPLALSALVAACSAPAAPTDDETVGSAEDALRTPELAYFFVDRTPDGFVARGVNETAAACGREKLARCVVDDVDLSALGVSRRDARSLLDAIDDRSAPNAIVFLGTVGAARHGHRTLRAVEAWRAPRAARWGGTVYQVTRDGLSCAGDDCRPARALRLNAWRRSTVPDVVLAGAPAMATCRFVPAEVQPVARRGTKRRRQRRRRRRGSSSRAIATRTAPSWRSSTSFASASARSARTAGGTTAPRTRSATPRRACAPWNATVVASTGAGAA